jgi:hypothetical protein
MERDFGGASVAAPIRTPPIRCSEIVEREEDFDYVNEDTDGTRPNTSPGLWTSSTSSAWSGLYEVSGSVAGGPHSAFADDSAERTLGRIVYRRGEDPAASAKAQRDVYLGFLWDCFLLFAVKMAMSVPHVVAFVRAANVPKGMRFLGIEHTTMASIDLQFSTKHYFGEDAYTGWGSDITFFGLNQGWAVSVLGWLDTVAILVSAGIIRWRMVRRLRRVAPVVPSDSANDEKKALVSSAGSKPFDGGGVGKSSATLSATSISSLVGLRGASAGVAAAAAAARGLWRLVIKGQCKMEKWQGHFGV